MGAAAVRKVGRGLLFPLLLFLFLTVGGVPVYASNTTLTKPELKVSVKDVKITLTWNKTSDADGYVLYRYDWSTGSYTRFRTLSSLRTPRVTYTGKKDSSYRFKIRAYRRVNGAYQYSDWDYVMARTAFSSVQSLKSARRVTAYTAKLTWNKNRYATGILVYRADGKGSAFKRIAVLSPDTVTYTDTGLKKNVTYYYRLKAFRTYTGGRIYSGFGTALRVSPLTSGTGGTEYLVVGDSRTDFLKEYFSEKNSKITWICKSAAGYDWLVNTASSSVEKAVRSGLKMVFWFGVNDLYKIQNYIDYFNDRIPVWKAKGAEVYLLAVGPIIDEPEETNEEIEEFNSKMKAGVRDAVYLDLYTYLVKNHFVTIDGCHYDYNTCLMVYNYILKYVK